MKQQPQESATEFAQRKTAAEFIARNAPQSISGWLVAADGRTVEAAPPAEWLEPGELEEVHKTRSSVAETVAWALFVEAERKRVRVAGGAA